MRMDSPAVTSPMSSRYELCLRPHAFVDHYDLYTGEATENLRELLDVAIEINVPLQPRVARSPALRDLFRVAIWDSTPKVDGRAFTRSDGLPVAVRKTGGHAGAYEAHADLGSPSRSPGCPCFASHHIGTLAQNVITRWAASRV